MIAVLTTGRQDWGLLRPLCDSLQHDPAFVLRIIAGGMACLESFGDTAAAIKKNGFSIEAELDWGADHLEPTEQSGLVLRMIGRTLRALKPESLVLLGDRFETAAAAMAATLSLVPIIHLCGGEETEGAFDNSFRHAITKMAHLHLVTHEVYAQRILRMGEPPQTVHVVGDPAWDNIRELSLLSRETLSEQLGYSLAAPLGVVTVHPTTISGETPLQEITAIRDALEKFSATWVVTLPNNDPGSDIIRATFTELAARSERVHLETALGTSRYLSLVAIADFVLGNSSSAMTEAPALGIPTVNIGDRQKGRIRYAGIIDTPLDTTRILEAIHLAMTPDFVTACRQSRRIFDQETVARRIVGILHEWPIPRPPRKVFWDEPHLPSPTTYR